MDQSELIQKSFVEMMKDVGTSIPGHIIAFDSDNQLAQLQIGVKGKSVGGEWYDLPPIVECPVYMFGGSYHIECQIDAGAEGVILFSQRCIDGWRESGGIASNPIIRFHSFNDAMFLPGMRSKAGRLTGFQNNGIRISNADGTNYIWLKNDGTAAAKVSSFDIDGALTVSGNADVTGDFTGGTVATAAGIDLDTHTHGGVTSGGSSTGPAQ